MDDSMFKTLTVAEEEEFCKWAREEWKVHKQINPVWHPVVRNEWAFLDRVARFMQTVYEGIESNLPRDHSHTVAAEILVDVMRLHINNQYYVHITPEDMEYFLEHCEDVLSFAKEALKGYF